MEEQKKTFTKAEIEVIRFEKTDVIATSIVGSADAMIDEGDVD